MALIAASNLSVRREGRFALQEISFELDPSRSVAVLGPPGAGKTTLLRVLCGLERPSSGSVQVAGHSVSARPQAVKVCTAAVFGASGVDPLLTVAENVSLFAAMRKVPRQHRTGRAAELLHRFELFEVRDLLVRALTPGQRLRLAVVCGLIARPALLLLDDVVAHLDQGALASLHDCISELRSEAQTTVICTGRSVNAVAFCEYVMVLYRGRVVALDSAEGLRQAAGPDVVMVRPLDDRLSAVRLRDRIGVAVDEEPDGTLTIRVRRGEEIAAEVMEHFSAQVTAVHVRKPSLADAYAAVLHGEGEKDRNRA
ncbi:MAG: ATP-binding cassette domain-containing protein [Armatimonadota bacterium]